MTLLQGAPVHLGPVWGASSPLPLCPLSETAGERRPRRPRSPRGPSRSTFVWTMPGLWSLKCSRVAAISISFAPARNNQRRSGEFQHQAARSVVPLWRRGPFGLTGPWKMITLIPQPARQAAAISVLREKNKARRFSLASIEESWAEKPLSEAQTDPGSSHHYKELKCDFSCVILENVLERECA